MDQAIRNKLRNVVTQCRKLLRGSSAASTGTVWRLCRFTKDKDKGPRTNEVHIEDEARMTHLSEEDQAYRKDIINHFEHIKALGYKTKDALDQLIREIAFTHLNRLCAYKLMEARQVWIGGQRFREAVSRGRNHAVLCFILLTIPRMNSAFGLGSKM